MGAKFVTITKGNKTAEVVDTSVHVWKEKGWSVKGATKTQIQTPKTEKPDDPKESATER